MRTRGDLVRELALLRGSAARGTGRARVPLAELARRVDVPRSTVHTYVTGATLPPAEVLDRIVIALACPPAEQARWAEAWERVTAHEHETRHAAPPPSRPAPRQLPPDVPAFTGRADSLRTLDRLLAERSGRAVVLSAIAGTAGVGKTALAVHWAHRVTDRFPDGQLHLNLRGYDTGAPVTPSDAAAVLLRGLGVDDVPASLGERACLLRSLFADRRILVLLDNASSAEQVRHLLPATPSCFTLVTSRDQLSGLTVREGAHRIDLDVLTAAEALALLRELLGERVEYEQEAAADLARLCSHLPLALRIAAELARSGAGTALRDVVGRLTDERRRLDLLDSSGDTRTMIRAVFSWSYRHLPRGGAELFRLLGCHPGRDFDVATAAALAGCDVAEGARRVDLLVRANLVQARGGGRYDMHDLLRDYSRDLAEDAEFRRPATLRLVDHYLATATAAIALTYPAHATAEPVPVALVRDETTARAWLTAESDNLVAVVELASAGFADRAARLAAVAARHFDTTARWPEALTMHRAAHSAARALNDPAAAATALRNLGMASEALGDHEEALGCFHRCADLRRTLDDRPGTAAALTSIGVALDSLCRFDEAITAHRQSLDLRRQIGDAHGAAVALLNLGVVFEERGDRAHARDNYVRALSAFRTAGDPLGEAHARTNLGNVLNLSGEHEAARRHLVEALAAYRELGSRIGEAFALNGLGVALSHSADPSSAIARYTEALEITREINDMGLRAEALNHLAATLCTIGDRDGAREAHTEAMEVASTHGDVLEEANALRGLGTLARSAGDVEQAREHWQRSLELYEKLRVPESDEIRGLLAEL